MISQPNKLGDILKSRLGEKNLSIQADSAYICAKAQEVLPDDAIVKSFRTGVLKVYAKSSARATILSLGKNKFRRLINEKINLDKVKKINFLVSNDVSN